MIMKETALGRCSSTGASYAESKTWQRHKVINVRTGESAICIFALVYRLCVNCYFILFLGFFCFFCLIAILSSISLHSSLEFFFSYLNLNSIQYSKDYEKCNKLWQIALPCLNFYVRRK